MGFLALAGRDRDAPYTPSAYAQTLYGTLVGNVTDSTGAAVVGATVTATDAATGIAKTMTTDSSGAFRLSNLGAGTYKVSISAKSFASTVGAGIEVQTNTERRFDAQLQTATVGQDDPGDGRASRTPDGYRDRNL